MTVARFSASPPATRPTTSGAAVVDVVEVEVIGTSSSVGPRYWRSPPTSGAPASSRHVSGAASVRSEPKAQSAEGGERLLEVEGGPEQVAELHHPFENGVGGEAQLVRVLG